MSDDPFADLFGDDRTPSWLSHKEDHIPSIFGDPFGQESTPFDTIPGFHEWGVPDVPFATSRNPPPPPPPPSPPIRHQRFPTSPPSMPPFALPPNPGTFVGGNHLRIQFNHLSHTRQHSLPPPAPPDLGDVDVEFAQICADRAVRFNPHHLGFIPSNFWPDQNYSFGDLVTDFFQKKNNSNSRFSHKLYNALKIADEDPFYVTFLGIEWVTDHVLKIDKKIFARLLGIKTIDGSLFHQQGNFPSHGFVELNEAAAREAVSEADLEGVDYENVRLFTHRPGIFIRGCTEEAIDRCKWISSRKRVSTK
jgi:hypothetical protein